MEQPRGDDGRYISVEKFIMSIVDERFQALRREDALNQKALDLQAEEYARRLEDLNHAHSRAQTALNTFVSNEKYEAKMEAEKEARDVALKRIDERIASLDKAINAKLDDYITKAEARQAELDQTLANQKGAAEEAQRAAEKQGRESKELVERQHRKTNRNMALVALAVTITFGLLNWLGA